MEFNREGYILQRYMQNNISIDSESTFNLIIILFISSNFDHIKLIEGFLSTKCDGDNIEKS